MVKAHGPLAPFLGHLDSRVSVYKSERDRPPSPSIPLDKIMLPPIVAPGSFAEGWSVTFPLSHDSNAVCLILPSISFRWVESPVSPPLVPVSNLTIPTNPAI